MWNDKQDKLRAYYDKDVARRDSSTDGTEWKVPLRNQFAAQLHAEGFERLLEIGAGTGKDSEYFVNQGFAVKAIDLSNGMVAKCRAKSIDAEQMDMTAMRFNDAQFDAVYALNSLLHLTDEELTVALQEIKRVMRPKGLFFYGVYGGRRFSGIREDDEQEPKRYFNFYDDEEILAKGRRLFELVSFESILVARDKGFRFQAMVWRR